MQKRAKTRNVLNKPKTAQKFVPGHKFQSFGIIGYGRFGQLWAECLKPFGELKIFDKKISAQTSLHKTASTTTPHFAALREVVKSDLIFLLVPISEMESVCKKIAPLLKPHTLVVDACSVKVAPVKAMKKWLPQGQQIIATHPLFGPDSVKRFGLKGQKIVVCNVRTAKQQLSSFEKILKKLGLNIIHSTPEKHDEQMARSQALVHFIGRGLTSLDLGPQAIATPDYNTLLRMNDMVQNDTWQLFYDMQNYNPYTGKIRRQLIVSLQKLNKKL